MQPTNVKRTHTTLNSIRITYGCIGISTHYLFTLTLNIRSTGYPERTFVVKYEIIPGSEIKGHDVRKARSSSSKTS